MYGCIFLVCCLGCAWVGKTSLTRYRRSQSQDPYLLGQSVLGFLGSALNLAAAGVLFFK
jgi:hypothetical protein